MVPGREDPLRHWQMLVLLICKAKEDTEAQDESSSEFLVPDPITWVRADEVCAGAFVKTKRME